MPTLGLDPGPSRDSWAAATGPTRRKRPDGARRSDRHGVLWTRPTASVCIISLMPLHFF